MDNKQRRDFLHSVIALNFYPTNSGRKSIYGAPLNDLIFVGQDTKIIPPIYHYPIWHGLGTAVLCQDISQDVDVLSSEGKILKFVFGGGILTSEPEEIHKKAEKLSVVKDYCPDASDLSAVASYLMARRREKQEHPNWNGAVLNRAGINWLGWPKKIFKIVEKARKNLEAIASA